MTPSDVETAARSKYNATSDTFFGQTEIMGYMTEACAELARETFCIEGTASTTSTQGTQTYAFPTNFIAIKRVTYNGTKMYPITFREDDALTLSNSTTTAQGRSQYYAIFNSTIYLRPIPDTSSLTIAFFGYKVPADITISSTLEIPAIFHHHLADYIVAQMAAKDQNYTAAQYFIGRWNANLVKAKVMWRKFRRADSFATIQDENTLPTTIIGAV